MLTPDFENVRCDKALCRIAQGDCSALDVIYETLGRRIFFLALSILHNRSDAEDAASDTLLEVLQSAARYQPGSNARAWVLAIARNQALKKLRDRKTEEDAADHENDCASPDEGFASFEILSVLRQTLTAEEERIVLLHYYGGYKFREIAEMTGESVESVKKRSQRALKKLAEQLSAK